jgi:dipeptidyl aminopeptidase/acylaminoacyl peptidase
MSQVRPLRSLWALTVLVAFVAVPVVAQERETVKPNYELAARWMTKKIQKLVFDTSVQPHWAELSDRFWYSFETPQGTRWMLVDPVKRTRAPLFDNAKMAAMLTKITRIPYDSQHLPVQKLEWVNEDAGIRFYVEVPKDAEIVETREAAAAEEKKEEKKEEQTGQVKKEEEGGKAEGAEKEPEEKTRKLYFEYGLATGQVTLLEGFEPKPDKPKWAQVSPDGQTILFARGQNLYMMDAASYAKAQKDFGDATVQEAQLTTDGEQHYGFARRVRTEEQKDLKKDQKGDDKNPAGPRVPAIRAYWAQDSTKFAVERVDQRKVADLWVIDSLAQPRPKLETYRYAMPGEKNVDQSELVVFDRGTKQHVKVKADRFVDQSLDIATAPMLDRDREQEKTEPRWVATTAGKLYFWRSSRDLHRIDVCVADTATGEVKTLIEERLNTYVETRPLFLVNDGEELIHWSERDGWGHYYLFDANGQLKNQITSGEFVDGNVQYVDEKARVMYFVANGHEQGEDPYFTHLYRVNLDGTGLKLLNPGDASHTANLADSGRYFVDTWSQVNSAPVSAFFDVAGNKIADLETTDVSALLEAGYQFPEPFKVKADDGVTDLFGVMYKPFDFDPGKKYPIIAYVYPGPQTESVTKTFSPRSSNIALAQLGFIVIEVGNRGGNPQRSKWYHNYGYGNLRDYGLADKKTAIEQLARRYPWIDLDKVGIWGHSGGGFMSTAAMLVYPDFFKVAVSESGNHENNIYNRWWSEKHHGVKEVTGKDGTVTFEYSIEKNSEIAKNLKGHLLLVTGDIDDNVHPANTLRLANALIKANKRFDFFILPGMRHSFRPLAEYTFWLRGDYFVRHLLGAEPRGVDIVELNNEKPQVGAKKPR